MRTRETTRRESVRYDASGLPGVTLVGVEVSRCGHCGEHEVAIPRIADLHRAMAHAVVRKSNRPTPAEIRFLRRALDSSGSSARPWQHRPNRSARGSSTGSP